MVGRPRRAHLRPWRSILGAWALAAAAPAALSAQKTDVVVLTNGDRVTGEVMGVSRGKLDYKTDDAGRLSIEWEKVVRITSVHNFEVENRYGWKYRGRLVPAAEPGIIVVAGDRTDTLRIADVVQVDQLGSNFFRRTKAYLDVGFTLAKANKATTFSADGELDYRGPRLGGLVSFESYLQGQESTSTTTRNTLQGRLQRYLPRRWSVGVFGKYEQNDELNLLGRVSLGAGATRSVHETNRSEVSLTGGLVGTRERFSLVDSAAPGDTATSNLEGLLNLTWSAFRFDSPKLDLSTSLTAYPSLSDFGRVRADLSLRLKYELVRDFFVGLNFSDTFDSRPPDPNASRNDYVSTITIGWSYRR